MTNRPASVPWAILLMLLAFGVRLYRLGEPVLRWDEGWSLAHASLPWAQLVQVAADEWHPPFYVILLKFWLVLGKGAWGIRYLSVLLGVLAVPLAYIVAKSWSGKRRVALLSAGFAAFWPLLVYYGQVARMYALAAIPVLAAAWFLLRREACPDWRNDLGLVLSASAALYTLYHTAWALLGLWAYVALTRSRSLPRLIGSGLAVLAACLPWLLIVQGSLGTRVAGSAQGSSLLGLVKFLPSAVEGFGFIYGTGWYSAIALGLVLLAGMACGGMARPEAKRLLLPLLVILFTALGVAYGAQTAYWFAARHLVSASPFLGLLLAWALDRLAARRQILVPIAIGLLVLAYWPSLSRFVYEKTLEVTDPFDPAADYRYLSEHAAAGDLVYFNALAKAGWYENLRRPADPRWSFAMRWDPIIEPMARIAARILQEGQAHRLWFVLYQGDYGPNAELKAWLDANLYPAGSEWRGDTLYLAYALPNTENGGRLPNAVDFVGGIRLEDAAWDSPDPAGACAVSLTWVTAQPITASYKVFVHLTTADGRPLAQHDGLPGQGLALTSAWLPGHQVLDRHGLFLPRSDKPAILYLRVGLYDAQTGQRLRLLDGADFVELGALRLSD